MRYGCGNRVGDDLRAGSAHLAGNHKLAGVRGSVCRLPHDRWTIGSGKPDQQTLYKGHHLLNDRNRFGLSSCASLSSVLCDARLDYGGLIPDDIGAPASTQDPVLFNKRAHHTPVIIRVGPREFYNYQRLTMEKLANSDVVVNFQGVCFGCKL